MSSGPVSHHSSTAPSLQQIQSRHNYLSGSASSPPHDFASQPRRVSHGRILMDGPASAGAKASPVKNNANGSADGISNGPAVPNEAKASNGIYVPSAASNAYASNNSANGFKGSGSSSLAGTMNVSRGPLNVPQSKESSPALSSSGFNDTSSSLPAAPMLTRQFVARRISEGETGRLKEELKCQACGKGYKHISSLAKHLWEHTPEWNLTSKLLISKHQQVQLLEAASILVSMNEPESIQEEPEPTDTASPLPSSESHTSSHRHTSSLSPVSDPMSPSPPPPSLSGNQQQTQNTSAASTASPRVLPQYHNFKSSSPSLQVPVAPEIPISTGSSHVSKSSFGVRRTSMSAYPPSGARRSSVAAALSASLSESPSLASSLPLDNYTTSSTNGKPPANHAHHQASHSLAVSSPSPPESKASPEDELDAEEQRDRDEGMFGEMDD